MMPLLGSFLRFHAKKYELVEHLFKNVVVVKNKEAITHDVHVLKLTTFQAGLREKHFLRTLNDRADRADRADRSADDRSADDRSNADLRVPRVVGCHPHPTTPSCCVLESTYVPGTDLLNHTIDRAPFTETQVMDVTRKCAAAIRRLRDHGIVHLDVKPENIVLTHQGDVAVIDFESAHALPAHVQTQSQHVDAFTPVTPETCVTMKYASPEMLHRRTFHRNTDLWGVGLVATVMLCGYHPQDVHPSLYPYHVASHVRQRALRENWSTASTDYVTRLLSVTPHDRDRDGNA